MHNFFFKFLSLLYLSNKPMHGRGQREWGGRLRAKGARGERGGERGAYLGFEDAPVVNIEGH